MAKSSEKETLPRTKFVQVAPVPISQRIEVSFPPVSFDAEGKNLICCCLQSIFLNFLWYKVLTLLFLGFKTSIKGKSFEELSTLNATVSYQVCNSYFCFFFFGEKVFV